MDRNICFLEGVIDRLAYRKGSNGREYATFVVYTDPKHIDASDYGDDDRIVFSSIRVMVFRPSLVEHLRDAGLHDGWRVSIVAYINSYKNEDDEIINNVIARDLHLVKPIKPKQKK